MGMSNPTGPAVIVDPYSSGALYAPAFLSYNIPVIAVVSGATPPKVYAASYQPEHFQQIITASDNLREVADQLNKLHPRCVIAGCESGVELTEILAPQVVEDVANSLEKAGARRHKGEMAAAVANAGLSTINQICTNSFEEVEHWLNQEGLIGSDLVIKPPKSASTDGVTKVNKGVGWREIFKSMLGKYNRLGIINDSLIVQEYVFGTEYVVDTISVAGKHSVCDICKYTKINNGSYMAIYENLKWLPNTIPNYDKIINYTYGVLDAVGMRYGAAHVELMFTKDGPKLIELGARPHGGGHPRFCRLATNDSQIDRMVRHFAGLGPVAESFNLVSNVLVVFLICKKAGKVCNAEIFDKVDRLTSHYFSKINFSNSDWLEPTKDLFDSLNLGFVVLNHEDESQVVTDYNAIRKLEKQLILDTNN